VDGIIPEPAGGAHWDYVESANILKEHLLKVLDELKPMLPEERIDQRIVKFGKMGFWEEMPATPPINENGLGNVSSETASM
jgi:acetyl-CoA carboxylase carboxyl transferase subunit alpha